MHEKLVIVSKRKTMGNKILSIVLFILTCLMLVCATFLAPGLFALPAVLFGVLWYFLSFRSDIEYEYTYYEGDLKFAKIKAKSKRKAIAQVQMDDVLMLAPKGDRSVYKYETDGTIAYKNLTSGEPGAKIYELVCKGDRGNIRYEFEPDEDMLDAILIKYPRTVIK